MALRMEEALGEGGSSSRSSQCFSHRQQVRKDGGACFSQESFCRGVQRAWINADTHGMLRASLPRCPGAALHPDKQLWG